MTTFTFHFNLLRCSTWGEWLIWMGRFPVQIPLGTQPGLGTQPRYEAPSNLQFENENTDLRQVSEATSSIMAQSLPWDSQIAVKKKFSQMIVCICIVWILSSYCSNHGFFNVSREILCCLLFSSLVFQVYLRAFLGVFRLKMSLLLFFYSIQMQ